MLSIFFYVKNYTNFVIFFVEKFYALLKITYISSKKNFKTFEDILAFQIP